MTDDEKEQETEAAKQATNDFPDTFLKEGQPRPTVEQVAWVFAHLCNHLERLGSFRYLIYDRMGFGYDAYVPLYMAGGMTLSNAFFELRKMEGSEA